MAKNRYYYYDHEQCTFVEVRPARRRVLAKVSSGVVAVFVLAGLIGWGMEGMVNTPEEVALRAENEALQRQLALVQGRMAEFASRLDTLARTDQVLYRTLLEAEPISDDVRQVGVGGADPYEKFNRFSPTTGGLLRSSARQLDQLERKISLQNASYRELSKLAKEREVWLAQMPYLLPASGPIVSGYGMRRHPILRVPKMHTGIDVLVPTGSPVFVTGDGVVKEVSFGAGYGKHILVEHPKTGYVTLYAHLSDVMPGIRPGRQIQRGEQIGLSGSTGRSTAPHLHYEVRNPDGQTLNPVHFVIPSLTPQAYKKLLEAVDASAVSLD